MKKEFKKGDKVIIEAIVTEDPKFDIIYCENNSGNTIGYSSKSLKHAEPEFVPREMMVWNNSENCATKRKIIGVF